MISLKLALRTLKRFRLYTLINAASLVLSLACVLSLSRYLYREYTVDSNFGDLDNVFVTIYDQVKKDKNWAPEPIWRTCCPDFDGSPFTTNNIWENNDAIKNICILNSPYKAGIIINENQPAIEDLKVVYTDNTFFEMFPYKAVEGQLKTSRPEEALIMNDVAQRLFGTPHAVGKKWKTSQGQIVTVVGVIERPTCKNTFNFDIAYSNEMEDKGNFFSYGLVQLHQAVDSVRINEQLDDIFKATEPNVHLQVTKGNSYSSTYRGSVTREHLYPFSDYYWHDLCPQKELRLYWVLIVLLLIVGVLNYINLHSVILHRRKRDLQVKTVFGANRKRIFTEFLAEHFIVLIAIMPFIWLLVYLSRFQLNELFHIPLDSDLRFDIALTIAIPLLLSLAFSAWSFARIHIRKIGMQQAMLPAVRRSSYARTIYLFIQEAVAFCLIVFALYLSYHVYYLFNEDRGYRTENVLTFKTSFKDKDFWTSLELYNEIGPEVERRIKASPLFEKLVYGFTPIQNARVSEFLPQKGSNVSVVNYQVSPQWVEFFHFDFLYGRNWNEAEIADVGPQKSYYEQKEKGETLKIIVNETFWNLLTAEQQKGVFKMPIWQDRPSVKSKVQVVGVVKDFRVSNLTKPIPPVLFVMNNKTFYNWEQIAAVQPGKETEAIQFIKDMYKDLGIHGDLHYKWLEESIRQIHSEDIAAVKRITFFAIIAILISCLGLFGISLYDIRSRYKEIALRKINGAHNKDIYRILIRKYVLTLLCASLVATPFAFWGVTSYMDEVDNHAPLTVWIFLAAFLILVFVSLLTLFVQVHRAVHINAAEVMKSE